MNLKQDGHPGGGSPQVLAYSKGMVQYLGVQRHVPFL
jgi:hypothetical protein